MEEDHIKINDAAAPSEESMEADEDHDAMLRMLNERMQLQWGLAVQSAVATTVHDEAELKVLHDRPITLPSPAEKTEDSTDQVDTTTEASFFRLFNSKPSTSAIGAVESTDDIPRVRLQSPSSLTMIHGRSLNRILAVEDEEKALVKQRRKNIKSAAVDAEWVLQTSTSSHWYPYPQPSRKIMHKSLSSHTRTPLPPIAIAYLPTPKSSRVSSKVRNDVEVHGKIKLKAYPDLSKERVEDRILKAAKKRAALVAKNTVAEHRYAKKVKGEKVQKKNGSKRKSKKKRMHERETRMQTS